MARLTGPDESGRLVYRSDGTARAQGLTATVYADAGGTQLADILTAGGAAVSGSLLTVDSYSKLPLFQFPDGADTVYVSVNGGPVTAVYARTDDRLDALTTSVAGAETPIGAQAKASAAQTAAIAASARPTSIVVAASGGDYATIDAAIAAAPAAGAEIVLKRGTYTVSSSLLPSSKITLRGEGEGSVIKLADGANVSVIQVLPGVTDVVIRDLKIDGNRANQTLSSNGIRIEGTRIRVHGVHVTSANGYNIVAWLGSTDVTVMNCISEDARDEGIEFMGCVRGAAIGNQVRNIGKNAIFVWSNAVQGGAASAITIADNVISGAATLSASYSGIKVDDGATDVTIKGNVVLAGGTTSPGIHVDSSTTAPNNVSITSNTVTGSTADGIRVANGTNVTISGNTVRGTALAGIKLSGATCQNVVVTGNVVSASATVGIYADTVTGVQVVANTSTGNTQQGMLFNACTNIIVGDNRVDGNGGTTYGGLEALNGTAGTITGNFVRGTGAHGINVQGSAGLTVSSNHVSSAKAAGIALRDCTNVTCSGNVCRNNGTGGNTTFYNGIVVWQASSTTQNISVTGNRCYDDLGASGTQGYGVRTIGTVDNVLIANNLVSGNKVAGFGTDGNATNLTVVPSRKITATVGTTQTTIAHGLSYAPQTVTVSMTSAGTIWRSASSDATNIYLTADAAGRTADVLVG